MVDKLKAQHGKTPDVIKKALLKESLENVKRHKKEKRQREQNLLEDRSGQRTIN